MSATEFIKARDALLRCRENYDEAYREFRWPDLDRFNWALDYFDRVAHGNERPALWLVTEGAKEVKLSFAELSERCDAGRDLPAVRAYDLDVPVILMTGMPTVETAIEAVSLGALHHT